MRGVPGWQLARCVVSTLLRGAESIRMIYRARAGTFFCIFLYSWARVSVGLKTIPWSSSCPSPTFSSSGQNFFEEKFSPFQWTGRWKFATNGGSSRHFYTHLNALKTARIESREDSKTHSVAKIGENGVFFVKRARCNPRFSH
jgi:hypothetical protein